MRNALKFFTTVVAGFTLVFSGLVPANAEIIGQQNFSDPVDSNGISDIVDVQVNGSDEIPNFIFIFLTFDAVVADDAFVDDVWANVEIDTNGDGTEDYWIPSGYGLLSNRDQTVTIYSGTGTDDSGCEADFYGYPEDDENYVAFSVEADCLGLPATFGISAYVVDHTDESFDFAPDDGFYDVTNPTVEQNLFALTKTPVPAITGKNTVGSKLTAVPGTWDSGVSLNYQWFRQGTAVATGATYTTTSADLGKSITVAVTGSKTGYMSATQTSTAIVIQLPTLAKAVAPTLSGSNKAGSTLIAITGQWDSGVAFSFQWIRDGGLIANQTSSTYKTTVDDIGKNISVRVVGSKAGYESATFTSSPVSVVAASLSKTPTPTLSGTAKAGQTLSAKAGNWDSGVALSYQWLRNGVAIKGATKSTYKLVAADKGKKISVKVTGTKTGYVTVVKTSATKTISK